MNRCNSGTDSKVWMRKGKRIFTAETPEVLAVFVYKEGELMDDIKYMRRALELAKMAEAIQPKSHGWRRYYRQFRQNCR